MTTKKLIPTFLIVAMMLCSPAVAQPASELLEKAIFAEETVGNLDEAIGIYKQILDDAQANRALAARAQLRLAPCYMKKGLDAEATEAFENIDRELPGPGAVGGTPNQSILLGLFSGPGVTKTLECP